MIKRSKKRVSPSLKEEAITPPLKTDEVLNNVSKLELNDYPHVYGRSDNNEDGIDIRNDVYDEPVTPELNNGFIQNNYVRRPFGNYNSDYLEVPGLERILYDENENLRQGLNNDISNDDYIGDYDDQYLEAPSIDNAFYDNRYLGAPIIYNNRYYRAPGIDNIYYDRRELLRSIEPGLDDRVYNGYDLYNSYYNDYYNRSLSEPGLDQGAYDGYRYRGRSINRELPNRAYQDIYDYHYFPYRGTY